MEQTEVVLAYHDQKIKTLEREISVMREVQAEIRAMNVTEEKTDDNRFFEDVTKTRRNETNL